MIYSFELIQHPNIRYREAVSILSRCELLCMLRVLSISCDLVEERLGNASFLTFECCELSSAELSWLSRHSSLVFFASRQGNLLSPLSDIPAADYLPSDLPEILKYKGKTSVSFTRMMINTALSLSAFARAPFPLTVWDPLCGKGTAGFCALQHGMNAICFDCDRHAVEEAAAFFSRYLQMYRIKHQVSSGSETAGRHAFPVTVFTFANTKERYRQGDLHTLRLACGDSEIVSSCFRKARAHVLIADLPYGIQHAPVSGRRPESFLSLLRRCLPVWYEGLYPGGVIALSFNTLTLARSDVLKCLASAGFELFDDPLLEGLAHEVEHSVVRDLVFALRKKEDRAK